MNEQRIPAAHNRNGTRHRHVLSLSADQDGQEHDKPERTDRQAEGALAHTPLCRHQSSGQVLVAARTLDQSARPGVLRTRRQRETARLAILASMRSQQHAHGSISNR